MSTGLTPCLTCGHYNCNGHTQIGIGTILASRMNPPEWTDLDMLEFADKCANSRRSNLEILKELKNGSN